MESYDKLIKLASTKISESVSPDTFVCQSVAALDDLTVELNHLSKRLREWLSYLLPEVDYAIDDNEHFVEVVATKSFSELQTEYAGDMNADVSETDYAPIVNFALLIKQMFDYKQSLMSYLDMILQTHAPNMRALAGTPIASRLIASAGSTRRLAMMPASTIQLLGAEKALFRHLRTGARSPKHGYIFNHQFIQRAPRNAKGRVARTFADKLALCAKLDYFKGEFLGEKYKSILEKKYNQ